MTAIISLEGYMARERGQDNAEDQVTCTLHPRPGAAEPWPAAILMFASRWRSASMARPAAVPSPLQKVPLCQDCRGLGVIQGLHAGVGCPATAQVLRRALSFR